MAKKETDSKLIARAQELFTKAFNHDYENIKTAFEDLRFRAGEQWDELAKRQRQAAGKPCITVNQLPKFCKRVVGELRQNRPSIKVRWKGGQGSNDIAEIYNGIIRDILDVSDAQSAFMLAADSQVSCGIGHIRAYTEYNPRDFFSQDIKVAAIRNQFAVVWDPSARMPDRSDANYCFVTERLTVEEFEDRFGEETSKASFDEVREFDNFYVFNDQRTITVVEFWEKKKKTVEYAQLVDGSTIDLTDIPPEGIAYLEQSGQFVTREKRKVDAVYRTLLNGTEVLEKTTEWPSKYIPIIPIIGEEVDIGERIVRHGIIRFAKDPQVLYNYMRSAQLELVAQQPKSPYLVTEKHIALYKDMWAKANTSNLPFLVYEPDPQAPSGPMRQQPPVGSQGMSQEIALAAEDMRNTTGIYDAALGGKSNEQSGVAIGLRTQQTDTGNFVYYDNFAAAIRSLGRILVDLIPVYYNQERVVRLIGEDGAEDYTQVNVPIVIEGQVLGYFNDLTAGRYDVAIDTGPSYTTRRQESATALLEFARVVPQAGQLAGDLIAKNMDWVGAQDIAERLHKLLPPEMQDAPNEDDMTPEQQQAEQQKEAAMQQQQQMMQMLEQMEIQTKQAEAKEKEAKAQGVELDNAKKQLELSQINVIIQEAVQRQVAEALLQMTQQQATNSLPEMGMMG